MPLSIYTVESEWQKYTAAMQLRGMSPAMAAHGLIDPAQVRPLSRGTIGCWFAMLCAIVMTLLTQSGSPGYRTV